jgi:hypothetical protein
MCEETKTAKQTLASKKQEESKIVRVLSCSIVERMERAHSVGMVMLIKKDAHNKLLASPFMSSIMSKKSSGVTLKFFIWLDMRPSLSTMGKSLHMQLDFVEKLRIP